MADNEHDYLTPKQLYAIGLLIEGKNDRETAEIVGVSRATVNVWKNLDNYFIAEYNSRINQLKDTTEASQHEVVLKAYRVIDKVLDIELQKDEPDTRVALGVIRNFKATEKLETNSEAIENRQKVRELNQQSDLKTAQMFASIGL